MLCCLGRARNWIPQFRFSPRPQGRREGGFSRIASGRARPAVENVRVNVRELGNTSAETNRKQFPSRVDFIGPCLLL